MGHLLAQVTAAAGDDDIRTGCRQLVRDPSANPAGTARYQGCFPAQQAGTKNARHRSTLSAARDNLFDPDGQLSVQITRRHFLLRCPALAAPRRCIVPRDCRPGTRSTLGNQRRNTPLETETNRSFTAGQ